MKNFGNLNCLKMSTLLYPVVYIATPFALLLPYNLQGFAIFMIMIFKSFASAFTFSLIQSYVVASLENKELLGSKSPLLTQASNHLIASGLWCKNILTHPSNQRSQRNPSRRWPSHRTHGGRYHLRRLSKGRLYRDLLGFRRHYRHDQLHPCDVPMGAYRQAQEGRARESLHHGGRVSDYRYEWSQGRCCSFGCR